MENDKMPFVAIIGGFWTIKDDTAKTEAEKTATEFGAALATAGMGLVVYFSDPASLEPYVVSGYVKTLPRGKGAGSIKARYAQSQIGKVRFPEQAAHKDYFAPELFPGDD
jgi:hypothetical protein